MRSVGEAVCAIPKVLGGFFLHRGIQPGHCWQDNIGQDGQCTGFSAAAGAASPGHGGSDTAWDGSNLMAITRHKANNGSWSCALVHSNYEINYISLNVTEGNLADIRKLIKLL